jgi:hypothetical protein
MVDTANTTKNSVGTKHPDFSKKEKEWQLMRDSAEGEGAIKDGGETYLTMPPAMKATGDGQGKYNHYKEGADYVELITPIIDGIQGLIHQKEPEIKLPKKMEYLLESATPDGKPLVALFQDITRELLTTGRIGLLPEIFPDETDQPVYLTQYTAESVINWRKAYSSSGMSANLVVLEEISYEPSLTDEFSQEKRTGYRVLRHGLLPTQDETQLPQRGYTVQVYKQTALNGAATAGDIVEPSRIGKKWESIPFICINSINLEYDPGPIPLLPTARRILSAYQKSASYNRALYLCADPTVVRCGIDKEEASAANVVGGGNCWNFENPNAKVTFLELNGNSIPFQRDAIEDDFKRAEKATGRLFDTGNSDSKQRESADAIRLRQSGQQATTKTIVINGAQGMEQALKQVAVVLGVNPDEVEIIPNLDFAEVGMTPADLVQFMAAKNSGAPITRQTIHGNMVKGGMTNLSFDEEMDLLEEEGGGLLDDMVNGTSRNKPGEPHEEDEADPKEEGDPKAKTSSEE